MRVMSAKIALITGAGSGIGRAVALALAEAGFRVVLAGRRLAQLEQVAHEAGSGGVGIAADVTDRDSVDALFEHIARDFGRLDLLFNNAGVSAPPAPLEDLPFEQWGSVLDTNL